MKQLKLTLCILIVLGGLAATVAMANWIRPRQGDRVVNTHTGLTIDQVRELTELVTAKLAIADVQETVVRGRWGGRKIILVVKGDLLVSVDLSLAKFEKMDQQAHSAVLVLPPPRVISVRLDHDKTHIAVDKSLGWWCVVPGDAWRSEAVNVAYAEAQENLSATAANEGLIDKSRRHAEAVITAFFRDIGWRVTVRWQ